MVDKDRDGVVDEASFRDLITQMNVVTDEGETGFLL
jgi:hypothetical protein